MTESKISLCKKYIEAMAEPAVSGEYGLIQVNRVCNAIFNGFDLSCDEGWPIFMDYCSRCLPPFTEKEAKHIYNKMMKIPLNGQRGWLLNHDTEQDAKQ